MENGTMKTYSKTRTILKGALVVGGICAMLPYVQSSDVLAQGIGLRKLDRLMIPTESKIERGETIYSQNCAECHGETGQGNGSLADQFQPPADGFTSGEFQFGGGTIQIYNMVSKGAPSADVAEKPAEGADGAEAAPAAGPSFEHPVFNHLAYQDRWAVAHYVRSLGPTDDDIDPPAVVERARFEAQNGVCNPEVKKTLSARIEPPGEEAMATAEKIYSQQCVSCHGAEGKGDGAAAAALKPPPRNFQTKDEKWTRGTSPLQIFETLTQGVAGTSMAAYAQLSEDDRWALAHYIRETWVPDEIEEEATQDQIMSVCRAVSSPPKPPAIPVESAMKFMVEDAPEDQKIGYLQYGPAYVEGGSDKSSGQRVYETYCQSCHGPDGVGGTETGAYGAFPPYLNLRVSRLVPAMAGGSVEDFANRSIGGVHATLPNMTPAALMTRSDWRDLHAFVTTFDGDGKVLPASAKPPSGTPEKKAPSDEATQPGGETPPQNDETTTDEPPQPAADATADGEDAQPSQKAPDTANDGGSEDQ